MKNHILHTLKASKTKFQLKKYTFEFIGYDFIIDENL